ncbi:5900_t:CDS:2 [Funneliformis geosporum]|uniref:5900_t:CDS:1 n=1 Tax=Funneliformis geosporum TaxID=1117311 RepID=A0A9W4T3T2_9GLOM|nr:5900_t:CDS:2 [Funneliformis geosporum]
MGRRQHFLTPYVIVFHSANKSIKYAVSRACVRIYTWKGTTYTPEQIKNLLDKSAKDRAKFNSNKPVKKRQRTASDELTSDDVEADQLENDELMPFQNENTLNNYVFHPLTASQVNTLEGFLLVTISYTWNDADKSFYATKLKFEKIDEETRKFKNVNIASPILPEINDDAVYNTPNVSDNKLSDEKNDNINENTGSIQAKLQDIFIESLEAASYLTNILNN